MRFTLKILFFFIYWGILTFIAFVFSQAAKAQCSGGVAECANYSTTPECAFFACGSGGCVCTCDYSNSATFACNSFNTVSQCNNPCNGYNCTNSTCSWSGVIPTPTPGGGSGGGGCGTCSARSCQGKSEGDVCSGGTCMQHQNYTCSNGSAQCDCRAINPPNPPTEYTEMYVYVKAPVGPGGSLEYVRTAGGLTWWGENSGICQSVPVIGDESIVTYNEGWSDGDIYPSWNQGEVLKFAIDEGQPQYCQRKGTSGSCDNWNYFPNVISYNLDYDDKNDNFSNGCETSPLRVFNWIRRIELRGTYGFDVVTVPAGYEVDHVEKTDGTSCGYELRDQPTDENYMECNINGDPWCWICQGIKDVNGNILITIVLRNSAPTCTLSPGDVTMNPGDPPTNLPITISSIGANVDSLTAVVTPPLVASVCTSGTCPAGASSATDDTPGDGLSISTTAYTPGTTTYAVSGNMDDAGNTACTAVSGSDLIGNITVSNLVPWWQVKEGNVITGGLVRSVIPTTCITPGCIPNLITHDTGESPGVLTYNDSLNSPPTLGSGTVSDKGWMTNTNINLTYSYTSFMSKVPSAVARNNVLLSTTDINTLATTGTASSDGYYWWFANADLTLSTSAIDNLGDRKVILFVNGNLNIDDEIHVNKGKGFFLAIVSGNTAVNGSVGTTVYSSDPLPAIEGLFFAGGNFSTGSSANQLKIRGSIATSQLNLTSQRSLTNNTIYPAEIFEFGPDLLFNFPKALADKEMVWKEVEP